MRARGVDQRAPFRVHSLKLTQDMLTFLPAWQRRGNRYLANYNRDPMDNEQVVASLRKIMIRHTKSMRIGGSVALALPDADCETVRPASHADRPSRRDH